MNLKHFIKPYRKQFALGSFAKLVEALLELYLPILMAQILDKGIPNIDRPFILKTGITMLVLALLGFGSAAVCQYYAAITSQGTGESIRNALMEKISVFSYKELDHFGTSTLINRLTTDVNNYQQAVAMTMRMVFRAPFICIGAVIMSLSISPKLTIIFLILIPLLALALFLFMKITSPLYTKSQQKLDRFALIIRENLSGIRVIRAFATTRQENKRAQEAANEVRDTYTHVGAIFAWMNPISSILMNISIVSILYFGASFVLKGSLSQGGILSLTIYANKILYSLILMTQLVVLFTKASASSQRLTEVLNTEPSILFPKTEPEHAKEESLVRLSLNNVQFGFSNSKPLLDGLSFNMPVGTILGIVGVTGSGKSTLLDLLQRLYEPTQGTILIDGIDIKDHTESSLRQKIGVVPQHNVLFSGTIADNMRIGKPDATDDDIISALKTAQCWEFVKDLPDGIESIIFEGGKNFSGGQKQRFTIARALVKNPELLLLDDSLSALDYRTDLALRNALKSDYSDLSTIVVSQRISSVVGADQIIVLEHGKMVGRGTHLELLENCPPYNEICRSQMDNDEKENSYE